MDGVLLNLRRLSDTSVYDTGRQNILFKAVIVTNPTTTTTTTTTNFSFRLTVFFSTVTPGWVICPKGKHYIIIEARFFQAVAQQTLSTLRR